MYLVVLLIGVTIMIVDSQLIMRHAPSYLVESYRDPGKARQVAGMVTLLFLLVMVGVVLLVTAGLDPTPTMPSVLRRLGTLLILTAIAHAVVMVILSRLRVQQTGTELANAQMEAAQAAAPDAMGGDPEAPARTAPPPAGATRRGRGSSRFGRAVSPR